MKMKIIILILLVMSLMSIASYDWGTYRSLTEHSGIQNEGMSRFDLGFSTSDVNKGSSYGVKVFKEILYMADSGGIFYIYNWTLGSGLVSIDGVTVGTQEGDIWVGDLDTSDDIIDILGSFDNDSSDYIKWIKHNTTTNEVEIYYNLDANSTYHSNIDCGYDLGSAIYMCYWTNGSSLNKFVPSTLVTDTEIFVNKTNSLHRMGTPIIIDYDLDGDTEVIFECFNQTHSDPGELGICVVNTDLSFDNDWSEDGILEPVHSTYCIGGASEHSEIMAFNVYGGDYELAIACTYGGGTSLNVFDSIGGLEWSLSNALSSHETNFKQGILSHYDYNSDNYEDVVIIGTGGATTLSLAVINGLDGSKLFESSVNSTIGSCHNSNYLPIMAMGGLDGFPLNDVATCDGLIRLYETDNLPWYSGDTSLNLLNFDASPVIADLNNDGLLELIYSKGGNTTVYTADYNNTAPQFLKDTKRCVPNDICINNMQTFYFTDSSYATDAEGNSYYLGVDCYGNSTLASQLDWSSNSYIPSHRFCNYTEYGRFDAVVYISDYGQGTTNADLDLLDSQTYEIVVSSGNCYIDDYPDCSDAIGGEGVNVTVEYGDSGLNKTTLTTGGSEEYVSAYFDSSECDDWDTLYGLCPFWVICKSVLNSIFSWIFSNSFKLFLIILIIVGIISLVSYLNNR